MTVHEKEYFTLVFAGDITQFKGNPLATETPFGIPVAVGEGDAFAEIEELEDRLDGAGEALRGDDN